MIDQNKNTNVLTTLPETEKWENLTLKNRFLFAKVMGKEENALPLLQRLFPELHITSIQYVESEKTQEGSADSKSVRYDVYIRDSERRAFTLEMQVARKENLPMRSRYYSDMIDEDLLKQGQDYEELQPSYVIFICPFDLFGKGLRCYTFFNTCAEDPQIVLGDGAFKVFLNTKGTCGNISPEVQAFLDYVEGQTMPNDAYIASLDKAVRLAKKNANWRREYMIYERELKHEKKLAAEEGRAEGRRLQLIQQISVKIKKGKDLSRIADELEESEDLLKPIYEMILSAPDSPAEKILEKLQEMNA